MSNVVPFNAAVRGQSGRSFAYPTQNTSYADAWRLARVERLLGLLQDRIHCTHCLEELVVGIIERGDGLPGLEQLVREIAP